MTDNYRDKLIKFLDASPTSYHAVDFIKKELKNSGFKELDPKNKWNLKKGDKYFLTRNDSSLIAFVVGDDFLNEGIRIVSSHTDSPALKIKPDPIIKSEAQYLLNTEVYGGPILNTWFDRPLSIAGKVVSRGEGAFNNKVNLVDFKRNIAVIPNLPIHLNKNVNEKYKVDKKKGLRALFSIKTDKDKNSKLTLEQILAEEMEIAERDILDQDLYLYSTQKAELSGLNNEYISAGKLDNLAMVHASYQALLASEAEPWTQMIILYDNEEIGSNTPQGADSPFAGDVIERMIYNLGADREDYYSIIEKSILLSADMAHAVHPNFAEEYDENNKPKINSGPVLKYNAGLNYTTHSETAAVIINLLNENQIPFQNYTNRSDKKGGSTIGPIAATQLGIKSLDIGNPILAMHSIRELGGTEDHAYMIQLMNAFFSNY
jgi:aspartyl aminopeptidase